MIFVTRYSFITAILLSNLFFLFFIGLSRSNRVLLRIPLRVFAVLGAALLVKLLFPIEMESTIEISSFQIYPAIIAFLGKKAVYDRRLCGAGAVAAACGLDDGDGLHCVEQDSFLPTAGSEVRASAEHLRRKLSENSGGGQAGERVYI